MKKIYMIITLCFLVLSVVAVSFITKKQNNINNDVFLLNVGCVANGENGEDKYGPTEYHECKMRVEILFGFSKKCEYMVIECSGADQEMLCSERRCPDHIG